MKPYTKQDIENIYRDLIRSAYKNYAKNKLERVLKDLETAADWAYSFNHIYTDHEAEQLVKQIGDIAVEPMRIISPKANHCVLIDSFLLDNRGLSQQYLRAMKANGLHILVIYTNAGGVPGKDTIAEIKAYDKADAKLQNFRHFLWKEPFLESFNDVGLNDNSRHFSSMVK